MRSIYYDGIILKTPPIIDKIGTATKIRYLMEQNCLKPTDIQSYLGLTCVQTVYRWLEGINIPAIDNLYSLSQLFGVKIDDMIAGNRELHEKSLDSRILEYYKAMHSVVA